MSIYIAVMIDIKNQPYGFFPPDKFYATYLIFMCSHFRTTGSPNSPGKNFPSQESISANTENITKKIQELMLSAKENKHEW